MNPIARIHVAAGLLALAAGALAFAVRKGSGWHVSAGTWFCGAMFVLGVTASILSPLKSPPESPIGGVMVCYFVATAWMAARRRSGVPGGFERIACVIVVAIAAAILLQAYDEAQSLPVSGPPGAAGLFITGGVCLLAGLLDLKFILRGKLSATQRLSRHVWRMCAAFFIATGSFFLGQQDVLPQILRGSPILWVLAFSPFALMIFWLTRLRFCRIGRPEPRAAVPAGD